MLENDDERRTDDLFLFLYETVFWLLSRGVVIAPRRRRARAFPSSRARASSMGDVSWSFACFNRFLSFLYLRREQQFLVVFFVSTSEKMTDLFLFLFLFLCVFYSLSLFLRNRLPTRRTIFLLK